MFYYLINLSILIAISAASFSFLIHFALSADGILKNLKPYLAWAILKWKGKKLSLSLSTAYGKTLALALVENNSLAFKLLNCRVCLSFWLSILGASVVAIVLSLSFIKGLFLVCISIALAQVFIKLFLNPKF
jgi:hypothetical protein